MDEHSKTLLNKYGWIVECESPLEISNGETFATLEAARFILDVYKLIEQYKKGNVTKEEFISKFME